MRKFSFAAVVLVALCSASFAVAHGIGGTNSVQAVAGTFTAQAASTSTRTCTTTDGKTVVVTDGRYTGAASGSPDLTGPITLNTRSVINSSDDIGLVNGRLKIDVAGGHDTNASYTAVYDHGTLVGLATGKAHNPSVRLIANLSASFSATAGFSSGKLGGSTPGGSAVEVGYGKCKTDRTVAQRSEARGTISALSPTSITVAGLTCAIPSDRSAGVNAKFKTGDVAAIHCALVGTQNTLTKIDGKHGTKHHD
jgi:hypothetical protein